MKYREGIVMMLLVLLVAYVIVFNGAQIDHQQTISHLELTLPVLAEHGVTESHFRGNCHFIEIQSDMYVEDEGMCRSLFPSETLTVFTKEIHDLYLSLEERYNQYGYTVSLIGLEYDAQTVTNAEFYISCPRCDSSYISMYDTTGETIARIDKRGIDLQYTNHHWYVYAYD